MKILKNILEFNDKAIPRNKEVKDTKRDIYKSACGLYEGQKLTLNTIKSGILPIKETQGKQMVNS